MPRPALEAKQIDTYVTSIYSGVEVIELSRDDADDLEVSFLVVPTEPGVLTLPAGRATDLYVIEGEVTLDTNVTVKADNYAFVGARETGRSITHAVGAKYFIGTEASGEDKNDQTADQLIDPSTIPWDVRVQENCEHTLGGRSVGLVKFLRVDKGSRTTVGIGAMWPESGLDCAEYHEQLDEVLNLRGDQLLRGPDGEPAVADGLSYCWRPKNSVHLPKFSYGGSLTFFRNMKVLWSEHGACTFIPVPEWPELVENYRNERRAGGAS